MALWLSPEEAKFLKPIPVSHWFKSKEQLEFLGLPIEVRETPGHSPGGVVYYMPTLKMAVVGDDVFRGSIGRTDLIGGSHPKLLKSIKTEILTLPDETRLFPGHGPETTVGWERANNQFLK